jgi:hypothetical protein
MLLGFLKKTEVNAQDTLGWQRNQVIGINFQKRTLEPSYLPFDVPFRLYVVAPDSLGIDSIRVESFRVKGGFRKPDTLIVNPLNITRWDTVRCKNPTKWKLKPDDSLNSIVLFRHDIYSRDTLYANISVPLRPNQSYTFRCEVYRRVTDKESQDLDSIFTPIIFYALDSIYHNNCYSTILGALQWPDQYNNSQTNLIDSMTNRVRTYYYRKSLNPNPDSVRKVISSGLTFYLARTYGTVFQKRLFHFQTALEDIGKAKLFADQASTYVKLKDRRLFIKLDSLCRDTTYNKKYPIDSLTRQFISLILMDNDSLLQYLQAKRSEIDSGLQDNKMIPSSRVNNFRTVASSFYDNCGRVITLLKSLQKNPYLNGVINLNGIDNTDWKFFKNQFYLAVQNTKNQLDAYYSYSIAYDSLMSKPARFNFRSVFPIHFRDGSIGLTSADFVTRGSWYLIADIGFAYVNTYPTGQVRPYAGVNFNVFPINRQANYSLAKHPYYSFGGNLIRSLSITVGVTVFSTFGPKDHYTELLGTTGSLLTGISLRLSDGMRISSGTLWVYQKNANPLSDMKTLVPLWYGALSIDLTLKKWLGGIAKFF